ASFLSPSAHWRSSRPRAIDSDASTAPRIAKPASTSISVIARAASRAERREHRLQLRFIFHLRHVATQPGDEQPLIQARPEKMHTVRARPAVGGASDRYFARIAPARAGKIDLIDATAGRHGDSVIFLISHIATDENLSGEIE